jgi:short-subunit dehydrogenase
MAALKRMRPRGRGTIVQVGSALGYRSVPLQSAYCGAKAAIRAFTDSIRSELIHDGVGVHLTLAGEQGQCLIQERHADGDSAEIAPGGAEREADSHQRQVNHKKRCIG